MTTVGELFALGLRHHQAGALQQAEQTYRQILEREPRHAEALHFLGLIAHQVGNQELALNFMGQALAIQPAAPVFHTNLGAGWYVALGKLDQAVGCYQQALRLKPDFALAHCQLGNTLGAQGKLAEATACYREALRLQPTLADAHYSLGNALLRMGNLAAAAASYRQAIQWQPSHAEAYNNLGVTLFEQGKFGEAAASYQQALSVRPEYTEALNNLGNALKVLGRLDEAVSSFEQALRLRPDFADAHGNLADALLVSGRLADALASYRRALELRPDSPLIRSGYLFCLNYDPAADVATLYEEHCHWGRLHGQPPLNLPPHRNDPDPERRLRVGYLGDNFDAHAFACFIQPVLAAHAPAQVETVCYQRVPVSNPRLPSLASSWCSLQGMAPAQVADRIRADGIDILVDLLGHTRGNWLSVLPYRPAPVQATWLGYCNTTGLTCVDYRLTDDVADPPGEPACHTEELVRLPGAFCCYGPPRDSPPVAALPALANGNLTFGSHHNLAKLNPPVLDLWCQVLRAVPSARLLIYRDTLQGSAQERLLRQLAARGVSGNCVLLRQAWATNQGHLALYNEIDVVLDAFPWTGHTTTCDALWMGVPVLTLRGNRHAARMAASVLAAAGLPNWIAPTPEAFVARAVSVAADVQALGQLRASLRDKVAGSPLCDAPTFTRGLEAAYRNMWRRWCARSDRSK